MPGHPSERDRETRAGYHYEWVEEGADWRLVNEDEKGKPCRWHSGRKKCPGEVVAALFRGSRDRGQWWRYCEDHLYGRRIIDGRIEFRRLVPDDESVS